MRKWLIEPATKMRDPTLSKITDDPLAIIAAERRQHAHKSAASHIYAVSRINPIFIDDNNETRTKTNIENIQNLKTRHVKDSYETYNENNRTPNGSKSSGYISQNNTQSSSNSDNSDQIYSRLSDSQKSDPEKDDDDKEDRRWNDCQAQLGDYKRRLRNLTLEYEIASANKPPDKSRPTWAPGLSKPPYLSFEHYEVNEEFDREPNESLKSTKSSQTSSSESSNKSPPSKQLNPSSQSSNQSTSSTQSCSVPKPPRKHAQNFSVQNLHTIPEGQLGVVLPDFAIPRPVWPKQINEWYLKSANDLMFYKSLENYMTSLDRLDSAETKTLLQDVHRVISEILSGDPTTFMGELKVINEKIEKNLEQLQKFTDDDIRKLSTNLSCNKNLKMVSRALNSTTSSKTTSSTGYLSQESPIYSDSSAPSGSNRFSSDLDEIYQIPFTNVDSDKKDQIPTFTPSMFLYKDLSLVNNAQETISNDLVERDANKVRNSLMCETKMSVNTWKYKNKPSFWEIYYDAGVKVDVRDGDMLKSDSSKNGKTVECFKVLKSKRGSKVPIYPSGRPETDFTLDVPQAELLMKRMKSNKKWRCRCRIFTAFLGLLFFLISVVAVSLVVTRGKRMFGTML